MNDFRTVRGFEEVWRPPVRLRRVRPEAAGPSARPGDDVRARLSRLVRRAPEVVVKVTGRTRDLAHLRAHILYVSRDGELPALARGGGEVGGRAELLELAAGWAAVDLLDTRRRATTPMSVSVVLSMPRDTDPLRLRAAAAGFAQATFGEAHDYLLLLHTDAGHPHVHLTVRARGDGGDRLNPRKADLEAWRQRFALELRLRGIEAEATPRRARGVTRRSERSSLRKLRERFEAGAAAMPLRLRSAYVDAARHALGAFEAGPWERAADARRRQTQRLYLAQAKLLQASGEPDDRRLGAELERFVRDMPAPETRRLVLARALRRAATLGLERGGRER